MSNREIIIMSNPKEIFKTINNAFGIENDPVPIDESSGQSMSVSTYDPQRIVKVSDVKDSLPIVDQDLLDDFTFARKSQQMIIESVQTALQEAIAAAIATGSPEGFSSVAALMSQLNVAHKNLLEIHRSAARANKEKKTSEEKPTDSPQPPKKDSSQSNVFMAGTTEELIRMAKQLGVARPIDNGSSS